MLEAHLRLPKVTVKCVADNQKDLFKELASATEVFGETCCGLCESEDIRFVWRTVTSGKKTYEYAELRCQDCHAKLAFGMSMDAETLFPKRKLDNDGKPDLASGSYGKHRGWSHYNGKDNAE